MAPETKILEREIENRKQRRVDGRYERCKRSISTARGSTVLAQCSTTFEVVTVCVPQVEAALFELLRRIPPLARSDNAFSAL